MKNHVCGVKIMFLLKIMFSDEFFMPAGAVGITSEHLYWGGARALKAVLMPTPALRFPALTDFPATYVLAGLGLLAGPGKPWQALAGPGRPWQATAGPGRLRQALAGLSLYVRVRSAPACPSPPSTGPAAAIRAIRA